MHEVLRRSLPKRILRRLGRHPVAVVSVVNLALKSGRETYRWHAGMIDTLELRRRLGTHVGTMSGGLAGAAAGSAAGTVVAPGLGTILGAFAGGLVGETLGGKAGRATVEKAESAWTPPPPTEPPEGSSPSDTARRTL